MIVQFGDEAQRSPRLADLAARCGGRYRMLPLESQPDAGDDAEDTRQLGR
jgi:hypothetical protein